MYSIIIILVIKQYVINTNSKFTGTINLQIRLSDPKRIRTIKVFYTILNIRYFYIVAKGRCKFVKEEIFIRDLKSLGYPDKTNKPLKTGLIDCIII